MKAFNIYQLFYGTMKFARKEASRRRKTHNGLGRGNRHVVGEFPADVPDRCTDSSHPDVDPETLELQRTIVKRLIREHTQVTWRVELIERRLFNGETIEDLAACYGIAPRTAASIVSRARTFLGFRERKPPKKRVPKRKRKNAK